MGGSGSSRWGCGWVSLRGHAAVSGGIVCFNPETDQEVGDYRAVSRALEGERRAREQAERQARAEAKARARAERALEAETHARKQAEQARARPRPSSVRPGRTRAGTTGGFVSRRWSSLEGHVVVSGPWPARQAPSVSDPGQRRPDGRSVGERCRPPGRSLTDRPEPARARVPSRRAGDAIGSDRAGRAGGGDVAPGLRRPAMLARTKVRPSERAARSAGRGNRDARGESRDRRFHPDGVPVSGRETGFNRRGTRCRDSRRA